MFMEASLLRQNFGDRRDSVLQTSGVAGSFSRRARTAFPAK
jgi:hypothetical protein